MLYNMLHYKGVFKMGITTMTTNNFQRCIDECNRCSQACYECFEACINEPDIDARRSCIKMLVECAKMCEMSTALMSMNGQFAKDHCRMCATVCENVLKIVKCSKMIIVNNVLTNAAHVLMNVEKWLVYKYI